MRDEIVKLWEVNQISHMGHWVKIYDHNKYMLDGIRNRVSHEIVINKVTYVLLYTREYVIAWMYDHNRLKSTEIFFWEYVEKMNEAEYFQYSTVNDTLGLDYDDYLCVLAQYKRLWNILTTEIMNGTIRND